VTFERMLVDLALQDKPNAMDVKSPPPDKHAGIFVQKGEHDTVIFQKTAPGSEEVVRIAYEPQEQAQSYTGYWWSGHNENVPAAEAQEGLTRVSAAEAVNAIKASDEREGENFERELASLVAGMNPEHKLTELSLHDGAFVRHGDQGEELVFQQLGKRDVATKDGKKYVFRSIVRPNPINDGDLSVTYEVVPAPEEM